jgi:hypothetical protein
MPIQKTNAGEVKNPAKLAEIVNTLTDNVNKFNNITTSGGVNVSRTNNSIHISASIPKGGGAAPAQPWIWCVVIEAPLPPSPYAAVGTSSYSGSGRYQLRLDGLQYNDWVDGTTYALNTIVRDNYNSQNRIYTMKQTVPANFNSHLAPHENAADWQLTDEQIIVEYAEGTDKEGSEKPIKDCVPVFGVGQKVRVTYRNVTINNETVKRYLLMDTLSYVGTPAERSLTMYEGKLMACFQ